MLKYGFLFGLAVLFGLLLTPGVERLARWLGALDAPDERRVNRDPVPRLGGVAIYLALAATLLAAILTDRFVVVTLFGYQRELVGLALGASVVMALGAFDDLHPLSPGIKLGMQAVAASIVLASGYRIESVLGLDLGLWSAPLTLLWVVGITNAFNLIDGLDGLAAGVGLIVSAALFSTSMYSGRVAEAMILAVLGGALLGFLRYNFHPARIFLGDSGSLLLGFLLSVVSIGASSKLSTAVAMLVPVLALGLPIMDTALAVLRRMLRVLHVVRRDAERERYEFLFLGKVALFSADRQHIHHRLLDLGITHRNAVLILYGICLVFAAGALALVFVREPNHALLLAAFGLSALVGIGRLNYGEMRVLRNGALLPIFDLPVVNRRMLHVSVDLGFVIASYLGAFWIAHEGVLTPEVRDRFLTTLPAVAFAQIASFVLAGLYRRAYRYTGIDDLLAMLRALALAVIASWIARLLTKGGAMPGLEVTVLDAYLLATLVVGSRVSFRILDHLFKKEHEEGSRVMIYGAGNAGVLALHEILGNPALGMRVVGFLDDAPEKRMRILQGCPVYAPELLDHLISSRKFDEVVFSSPKIPEERLRYVAARCAAAGLAVRRFSIGWEELSHAPVRNPSIGRSA